jgi:hypothetical protein
MCHLLTYNPIRQGPKLDERVDTPFFDANMFGSLHVEGQNDGDSTRSSSPNLGNGGVSPAGNGPARESTLMDSDIDDDFKASFDESGLLKVESAQPASSSNELLPKDVPGGLSRHYYAAKLNGHGLPDFSGGQPKANPWIPNDNSSFWNIYANRLRVYSTETGVCHLGV